MGGEDPRRRRVDKTAHRVNDMKIKYFLLLTALGGWLLTAKATDYGNKTNWVRCDADKPGTTFDVFYIHPTLFCNPLSPSMNLRSEPHLKERVYNFTTEQTDVIVPNARVFAPVVRQLDYSHIAIAICSKRGWRKYRRMKSGVSDTLEAFRYYLEHFNRGRPYILLGHSQGAMDLYLMMLKSQDITVRKGFVAAYLIGLPRLTANEINADMAPLGLRTAAKADDLGVIIGWNTELPEANNILFTVRNTFCINPLNWRTDAVTAGAELHRGALVYDRKAKRALIVKRFTGARPDPGRGALIVAPPEAERYEFHGFGDSGVMHVNDIWFFVVNIRENIELRVEKWKAKYGGKRPEPPSPRP